jgi:hypothetical protein
MRKTLSRFTVAALLLISLVLIGARGQWILTFAGSAATTAVAPVDSADSLQLRQVAATMHERLQQDGGCTVDPRCGQMVGSVDAFAVSIAGHESRFSRLPAPHEIEQYLRIHRATWLGSRHVFAGAWHDSASGDYFLDLSELVRDEPTAIARGRANHQRCIYHLRTGREVFLAETVLR